MDKLSENNNATKTSNTLVNKMKLRKIAIDYLIAILVLLFIIFLLPKLLIFFMPFLIGYFISLLANPVVRLLEKLKIVRKHGSALIIALAIVGVSVLCYFIITILFDQLISFSNEMPSVIKSGKEQFGEMSNKFNKIYDRLPGFLQSYFANAKANLSESKLQLSNDSVPILSYTWASRTVKSILEVIIGIFFAILSAYFFTADRDKLAIGAKRIMPEYLYNKASLILANFKKAIGGYFVAQFKIMIVLVAIMYVTLKLFGVEYSFLISLGIGFLDLLPVFGTGAVLWPWALYKLFTGNYVMCIGLLILYAVCQVIKQLLQPKMVGDSVGLNPLATLFLLFIGYKLGGIIGILIVLPIGVVVLNLYRAGTFDTLINDTRYLIKIISDFNKKYEVKKDDL